MQLRAASRVTGGFVCIAATAGVAAAPAEIVAPPAGPALAPRSHGFILYLSQPIGGGGGALRPKFGFRIDQVRMSGNSGAPDAGDPLQHRALVGWQMDGLRGIHASDMKVELGGRMTYDVTRGAFAAQLPKTSTVSSSRASALNRPDSYLESRPFSPHLFETSTGGRDPFRQSTESASMIHDITAAAIGTFKLTRPAPAQQRVLSERPMSMREAN
jgi:hypothetical protein